MKNMLGMFSFKAYQGIRNERFSQCIGFFFILILVISVLISLQFTIFAKTVLFPQINFFAERMLARLSDGFPETVIENGKLTAPRETFIREFKEKDFSFAFIIEPDEGKTQALLEANTSCMLLTQQKLIVKAPQQGRTKMEVYDLSKVPHFKIIPVPSGFKMIADNRKEFNLTPETAGSFLRRIMFFVWPVTFLLLLVYFCISKPLQLLFFSLISLVINSATAARLTYQDLLAIGIYALAPPTLVLTLLQVVTGRLFPGQSFIFIIIYVIYLYNGITANKTSAIEAGGAA